MASALSNITAKSKPNIYITCCQIITFGVIVYQIVQYILTQVYQIHHQAPIRSLHDETLYGVGLLLKDVIGAHALCQQRLTSDEIC
jgi:hypothetical protein